MKTLIILSICVLVLAGCTSAEYQKMQAERDQLLKDYEDLREENSELKLKNSINNILLGNWKFLSLELAESGVPQEVAEAKAALYALELKNLTLEFFEENGIYHYRGGKGETAVFGQFTVVTIRYGDEPFPFIRFIRRTGPEMAKLLFAVSADGRALGLSSAPGYSTARDIGISVTPDRLYLTVHGKMQSGPDGWVQSGGIRCYFERVAESPVSAEATAAEYQQIQHERERLRAAYESARIKNDRQTPKDRLEQEMFGTWQFLGIEVLESDLSNEIESAAAALAEASRKNLTIRFFEQNGMRFYEGNNGSIRVTGRFSVYVERIAEVLYPKLGMNRVTGIRPGEFLFSDLGGSVFSGPPGTSNVLISVQGNQLHLTLGAGVSRTPTPDGWVQSEGIRYSFKRVKN